MNKLARYAPWLIVIASLLWATDAPFRKFLTGDLPATLIVLSEHIILFIFILPIFIRRLAEIKRLKFKDWLGVVFVGAGGSALATVFFTQAFRYVNPSVAILLQKVQPFIAILLAVWLLKEILPKRFYLWAALGIVGTYFITFPEILPTGLIFAGGTLGVVYALLAAFFWAGSTVLGRFVLRKISWPMMTATRFVVALLFLVILNVLNGAITVYSKFTWPDGIFVAIIALVSGLAAMLIYYRGLKDTRASAATIGAVI